MRWPGGSGDAVQHPLRRRVEAGRDLGGRGELLEDVDDAVVERAEHGGVHAAELGEQGDGGGRGPRPAVAVAFDLDVQRHVRVALDQLAQRRHREVVGGVAGRRRSLAGADAAVDVVVVRAALPPEGVGVVEGLDGGEVHVDDIAGALRRAVDRVVVLDDHDAVAGQLDVEVEHVDPGLHALAEREHRRAGELVLAAGVGEDERSLEGEEVGDRGRRRGSRDRRRGRGRRRGRRGRGRARCRRCAGRARRGRGGRWGRLVGGRARRQQGDERQRDERSTAQHGAILARPLTSPRSARTPGCLATRGRARPAM